MLGPEPIPAPARIGAGGLRGIDGEGGVPLGQRIHRRARGKLGGVLATAMQHDEERHGLAGIATREIQLVGACPPGMATGSVDKATLPMGWWVEVAVSCRSHCGRGRIYYHRTE